MAIRRRNLDMLHILVKTSLTLCVCTVLLGTALGQSTSATLRIGCTDIYKEQHTLYLRQVKGKKVVSQKTQLNIHNMSEPFRYKGSSRLSFYRSQEEAEDTENKSKPCATCRVPAEGSYFLLLVPSVSKTGEKEKDNALPDYRILVIPSGDVAFGSFMLMNYSSHPLHARIDKTKGKVLPGKRKVFTSPKASAMLARACLLSRVKASSSPSEAPTGTSQPTHASLSSSMIAPRAASCSSTSPTKTPLNEACYVFRNLMCISHISLWINHPHLLTYCL